jgi:glycosyltransferase involved in cell wall biosynthesis
VAEAIIDLLNNSGRARRMGKRAEARVKDEFSAERMIERIEALYRRMLDA